MSMDDKQEWNEFLVDVLKSKFQGAPTEGELVDRLKVMVARHNAIAIRAATSAKLIDDPGGKFWPNRVWERGAIYGLTDIQMGPAGTDEAGLWRPDQGGRKG
jgi:hypothetical protein